MERSREGRLHRVYSLGNALARQARAHTILRMVGTPFQKLVDRPGGTHRFLTQQAVTILDNDGWSDISAFFAANLDTIVHGNYWADSLWKNSTHHYNPRTGRGLWIWPSAKEQCSNWFAWAVRLWQQQDYLKSLFALGACIHIVQDCCQPYHSNCLVLDGHQKYERWVDARKELYAINAGGIYDLAQEPGEWCVSNAEFSHKFLAAVAGQDCRARDEATRILLQRAQATTAGFMIFYLRKSQATCRVSSSKLRTVCGAHEQRFLEKVLACEEKADLYRI